MWEEEVRGKPQVQRTNLFPKVSGKGNKGLQSWGCRQESKIAKTQNNGVKRTGQKRKDYFRKNREKGERIFFFLHVLHLLESDRQCLWKIRGLGGENYKYIRH